MNIVKPRHPECRECKFFSSSGINGRCTPCGSGEFFEEKVNDRPPTDNELMRMFANMTGHSDDD